MPVLPQTLTPRQDEGGFSTGKERAMSEEKKESIKEQIRALREKAKAGELGDEVLEDVSGGHTDGIIHVDSVN
jgi:hypothetical protein